MISKRNILIFSLILVVFVLPNISSAAPIIPTCANDNCGFRDFIQLINNVVNFIIMISFPIAAGVFAWAGFNMMMDAGNGAKRRESIEMMKKVMIGFAIILVAWIVVNTLLKALLSPSFNDAVKIVQ